MQNSTTFAQGNLQLVLTLVHRWHAALGIILRVEYHVPVGTYRTLCARVVEGLVMAETEFNASRVLAASAPAEPRGATH